MEIIGNALLQFNLCNVVNLLLSKAHQQTLQQALQQTHQHIQQVQQQVKLRMTEILYNFSLFRFMLE